MMSDKNNGMNFKDFFIGAVFGGLVGAAVAMLTTPKTGKEMREELSKSVESAKEKGKEVYHTVRNQRSVLMDKLNDPGGRVQTKWTEIRTTKPVNIEFRSDRKLEEKTEDQPKSEAAQEPPVLLTTSAESQEILPEKKSTDS